MQSGKLVMMITPLMRDYKKEKRVNIGGLEKNREGERLRKRGTRPERKRGKQRG